MLPKPSVGQRTAEVQGCALQQLMAFSSSTAVCEASAQNGTELFIAFNLLGCAGLSLLQLDMLVWEWGF